MKPIVFCVLFVCCLCGVSGALAHQGSIRGIVRDSSNQKTLAGATVAVDATRFTAVTDMSGGFFLKGIKPGKHKITITYLGYEQVKELIIIENGVTTELGYNLVPSTIKMQDVSVSAMKDLKLTTIKVSEMKLQPVNSTQDLLRLVPGLFIAQHQGGGKAEQIFIRGFDCDHGTDINISVDNMPVNMVSHAHGQGFADAHFVIPESIQQLDYGKGPYEADKGNFYTGGYVSFKTKNALENDFIAVEGGMYNYWRTATGINLLNPKVGDKRHSTAYVMGEYVYNRGYFDASQDFKRVNVIGKYTNNLSENKRLSLTVTGFHSYWDASGQVPERAVDQGIIGMYGALDGESGSTSRYNLNLEYFQSLKNNSYIKSNVYATKYDFLLYSNFTFFASDSINGDQIRQGENRMVYGYNTEYTNNARFKSIGFKTQVGVGLRNDNIANNELSHTVAKTVLLDRIAYGDVRELNVSGYASEKISLPHNFTVNLGMRYDFFVQQYINKLPADKEQSTAETHRLSPKAGIVYNISSNSKVYYSYGSGFHSNDTRTIHLYRQLGGLVFVDNIVPRAFAHDLGFEKAFGSRFVFGAALWRLDLQQEFGYSGDAAVVDTSGRTRRYGIDFSTRCELTNAASLFFNINYAHGRFIDQPENDNYITLAPSLTSTGGIKYIFSKSITASIQYRHLGDRPATSDNSLVAEGYTLFDGGVTYSKGKFEYNAKVQNILNTKWREAQFATETRLRSEVATGTPAQTDICYTPGTPFLLKLGVVYKL